MAKIKCKHNTPLCNSYISLYFPSATCPAFGRYPIAHGRYHFEHQAKHFHSDKRQAIGTVVRFYCNPPYKINGFARATCTAAGTWSHETPTCGRGKAFVFLLFSSIWKAWWMSVQTVLCQDLMHKHQRQTYQMAWQLHCLVSFQVLMSQGLTPSVRIESGSCDSNLKLSFFC